MPVILHFADAHIDIASYGRHDPQTGLPLRTIDFLNALDQIIDAAINEKVDLVLFAGDAYKDRNPAPTFQREWGKRIMRLSQKGIPTLLLIGNHDISPAFGRAHTLQEFETLQVPHIQVLSKPCLLRPQDLEGLPIQIIALPWISRSGLLATIETSGVTQTNLSTQIEARLTELLEQLLEMADPSLPTILTAHATVQGALFGAERSVMLGSDLQLSGSIVRDSHLDYVALGHIHKAQDLNQGSHPPIVYSGSIERVDFGEITDQKYYIIAQIERGKTNVLWKKINGRKFIDRYVRLTSDQDIQASIMKNLPPQEELSGTIFRLILEYPRSWEQSIDEAALRRYAEPAFEFHLIRRPQVESRIRLPDGKGISSLSPMDLLSIYWQAMNVELSETKELQKSANEIISNFNLITSDIDI